MYGQQPKKPNALAQAARLPSTGGLFAGSNTTPAPKPTPKPPTRKPAPQVAPGQVPKVAAQLTAQQQITQLLQPLINQITSAASARQTQGTQAIQGYADALKHELAGVDYGAPYAGAQQRQAAVDSSLASAAAGQGLTDANSLASRLAVINDPTVATAAGNVAANGAANGTTLLAQGSNALGNLISNEASAKGYGLKLPGIAGIAGLQDLSRFQGQVSSDQAAALAKITGEAPGLTLQLLGQQATAARAKQSQANTDRSFKASQKKEAYQEWLSLQKLGETRANQSFNEWYKQQTLGIAQQRADTGAYNATHSKPGKLQHATVNGHAVTFDPNTGTYYVPGTQTPVDPGSLTKPPPKVSAAALSKARGYLQSSAKGFYASQVDPSKPLTQSQIAAAAKTAGVSVADFLADPKALAAAGIGWNQVKPTEDQHIQDLYVTLVKTYGIPARQAFQMVAGTYGQWGKTHQDYFPKAGAAESGINVQGATAKDASAVALVQQYVGTPYVWGGAKPGGFDCSGLLQYVWAKNGVSIPRTTYQQWTAGRDVTGSQLQPGDAVFFTGSDPKNGKPGHVGMYIGNGRFVEAPHTGASVRISTLSSRKDYVGARRYA